MWIQSIYSVFAAPLCDGATIDSLSDRVIGISA